MRLTTSALAILACTALAACDRDAAPQAPETAPVPASQEAPPIIRDDALDVAEIPAELDPEPEASAAPAPAPVVQPAAPERTAPERAGAEQAGPGPAANVRPASFARCQACHAVEPGAPHGIGPNLSGVMGAPMGSRPGYNYSEAMAASDQVWTADLLDAFLLAPREAVPGTKMMAAPVRDTGERQALIAYLNAIR